jgi:predicted metalloprotease with PDZ domain
MVFRQIRITVFIWLFCVWLPGLNSPLHAQVSQITYHVGWQKPNLRFYNVEMRINTSGDNAILLRIPEWRPGRYILQNFARNVVNFTAFDSVDHPLPFRKIDKNTWEIVPNQSRTVIVRYRYYASLLDAGNSYLDDREAYLNPATMLMYVPGAEFIPAKLSVNQPEGWQIATALKRDTNGFFVAENYHELIDNPLIVSKTMEIRTFSHEGVTFEIASLGPAVLDWQRFESDLRNIISVQKEIFGELPFNRYVFLYHFVDYRKGHGVEHKNSTSIVVGPSDFSDPANYQRLISVTAHEFFHVWNVERIRPEKIFYPDYNQPSYTKLLWWFEGVTSYYENLTLVRANINSPEKFIAELSRLITYIENNPANRHISLAEVSFDEWAKSSDVPPGTHFSFYAKGEWAGALLDLAIRSSTDHRHTLDDVMRYLYLNYAKKQRGVPEDGIQSAIEAVTGKSFKDFFNKYIEGTKSPDYSALFKAVQLLVTVSPGDTTTADLGIRISAKNGLAEIVSIAPESAAAEGGLAIGDCLLAVNRYRIDAENFNRILHRFAIGDTVTVSLFRRDELRDFSVVLRNIQRSRYQISRPPGKSFSEIPELIKWLGNNS